MGEGKFFSFIQLLDTLPGKLGFFETFSFQTLRLWFERSAESWEGLGSNGCLFGPPSPYSITNALAPAVGCWLQRDSSSDCKYNQQHAHYS